MKKQWKKHWKKLIPALLLSAVLAVVASSVISARAFEDYWVEEDNAFVVEVKQNRASSTATVKYATGDWYLFPDETDAGNKKMSLSDWKKTYSGVKLDLVEFTDRDETEGVSEFYDYFKVDADEIVPIILGWKTDAEGNVDRWALADGVDVYASRSLKVIKNGSTTGTYYCYADIEKQANWSGNTLSVFKKSFDLPLTLYFNYVDFTIEVVDENGNSLDGMYDGYSDDGIRLYGENIKGLEYPGTINGYTYTGYELVATYASGTSAVVSSGGSSATSTKSYVVKRDETNGEYGLVLRFSYEKEMTPEPPTEPPTAPPLPTETPVPSVSPTSTVSPTPEPTPVPGPQTADDIWRSQIWYYTTDKGYYVGQAADSDWELATKDGVSGTAIGATGITVRNMSYSIGTDSDGNTWYFIPDGANAAYVHPQKYGSGNTKYVVDSAEVTNIRELTFPSTITSGGTTYTVTSIGGATDKYTAAEESFSSTSTTTQNTVKAPSHSYYEYSKDSSTSTLGTDITVSLGVLGNGSFESTGYTYTDASGEGDWVDNDYETSYHYYNTTLYEITIPDSVTRIEDCAFINCQKLRNIKGGAGVAHIGEAAFQGASHLLSESSRNWKNGDGKLCYNYYYYNESYCFNADWTDIMLAWEKAVPLGEYLYLPEFSSLQTVGRYAFRYRTDLYDVVLWDSVTSIGYHAFAECKLDSITVPGTSVAIQAVDTVFYRDVYKTLGSNETLDKTLVIAAVESEVFNYARSYPAYYRVQAGYDVIYEPNGAVEPAETFRSDIEFFQGSYQYAGSGQGKSFVIEEDGTVWSMDTSPAVLGTIEGGFGGCELEFHQPQPEDGGYFISCWVIRSKNGTRWILAARDYAYSDGSGTQGSTISLFKHSSAGSAIKLVVYDNTLYGLFADGTVYSINLAKDALGSKVSGSIVFTDIYRCDTGTCEYLYGTSSDGKVYDILNSQAQIDTPAGVAARKYLGEDDLTAYCVDTSGNLWAYLTVGRNTEQWVQITPVAAYLLNGNVEAVFVDSSGTESRVVFVDEDSADMVYLKYTKSTYTTTASLYASASMGGGMKELYSARVSYDSDGNGVFSTSEVYDYQYLLGNDGSLYCIGSKSFTDMTGGKKLKKVFVNNGGIIALDMEGHIWSAGNNEYGNLGNSSTAGETITDTGLSIMTSMTCVSREREYVDLYGATYYSAAIGADGYLYGAGREYHLGYESSYSGDSADTCQPRFTLLGHHTGGAQLLAEEGYYTGRGYTSLRTKEFILMDKGYRFLHTVYSNRRTDGTELFTRDGYEFTGWNTAADGSGTGYEPGTELELSEPFTLYAQWVKARTRISYEPNAEGVSGSMADTVLEFGITECVLAKNLFIRTGYEFTGWNTMPDGTGTAYADMARVTGITKDMTLYAQWTQKPAVSYTLVYMTYPYGTAGNTVWKQKTMVNSFDSYGNPVSTTETIEGAPYAASAGYTVSYATNMPTGMSTSPAFKTALTGENTNTTAPVFGGWQWYTANASGGQDYQGRKFQAGQTVSRLTEENGAYVYLYPSWGGGNASVLLPEMASEGYEFLGWSETADGSSKIYSVSGEESDEISTFTPARNTILYAVWKPLKKVITLDGRGADTREYLLSDYADTFDPVYYYTHNEDVAEVFGLNSTALLKHYAEHGMEEGRAAIDNTGTYKLADYADVFDPVCYYKINADVAGAFGLNSQSLLSHFVTSGMAEGRTASLGYNTELTLTYDSLAGNVYIPVRENYVFQGYFTQPDGGGIQVIDKEGNGLITANNANSTFDEVDVLYAYWIPDKAILYDPNYSPLEAECPDMEITWVESGKSEAVLPLNLFTRTGYHFTGWNMEPGGNGTAYADGDTITDIIGKITLYAQWAPNEYIVYYAPDSFDKNPLITEQKGEVWQYDRVYEIKEAYEKYDIVLYDLNGEGKSTVPVLTTSLSEEHKKSRYQFCDWQLYEKEATEYKKIEVAFAPGQSVSNLTDEAGKTFVLFPEWKDEPDGVVLPMAACRGYIFQGWTDRKPKENAENERIWSEKYVTFGDITLYACWRPKEYLVVLDDRGATSRDHTQTVIMVYDQSGDKVVVPEKTGYIFLGYYTGTRGKGVQYYDKDGNCIKDWAEDNQTILYAYWQQTSPSFPEKEEQVKPTPLPEVSQEGNITGDGAKGLLYADDYNSSTNALTDIQPYLTYDMATMEGAIPGTEKVAFRAKMEAWMLNYKFHRYSGWDYVRIYVTVPYRTQYELSNEELVISDQQTKTYSFLVPKLWSYWTVLESGMYYPNKVTIKNEALKEGMFTVEVKKGEVELPDYEVLCYGEKEKHVLWETYDTDGLPMLSIMLQEEQYIISDIVNTPPEADAYLEVICENAAWADEQHAFVRSDKFVLNEEYLLSDKWNADGIGSAPEEEIILPDVIPLTSYLQTYRTGIELDENKPNGSYSTSAVITYVGDTSNVGTAAIKDIVLPNVNSLAIHTPVACDGTMLEGFEGNVLILKEALNFFTLRIDNIGIHRMSLGYGEKNFAYALSGQRNVAVKDGISLNQVKFPFDVYVDVENNSLCEDGGYDSRGDYCLKAETWLTIGEDEQQFYIPVTMQNGTYRIEFRTIAVNCPKDERKQYWYEAEEPEANRDWSNYVATDYEDIEVKSYIKGFQITDTNDPEALEILQAGCQALSLKKGYSFSYELHTQGEFYGEEVEITMFPKYFWESESGAERVEANLYQLSEIFYGKWKTCYAWEDEFLKKHKNYDKILQCFGGNGMIAADVLCVTTDTKQGYCAVCDAICYVSGSRTECEICQERLENLEKFSLEDYAELQTITGEEPFFKQNGYLVINLEIEVKSNTNDRYIFDDWKNTKLAQDIPKAGWGYFEGDIIRYNLAKGISDDYEVGGVE